MFSVAVLPHAVFSLVVGPVVAAVLVGALLWTLRPVQPSFLFLYFVACLDLKVFSSFSAGLRKTRVIQMEALDWRLPVQCVFS